MQICFEGGEYELHGDVLAISNLNWSWISTQSQYQCFQFAMHFCVHDPPFQWSGYLAEYSENLPKKSLQIFGILNGHFGHKFDHSRTNSERRIPKRGQGVKCRSEFFRKFIIFEDYRRPLVSKYDARCHCTIEVIPTETGTCSNFLGNISICLWLNNPLFVLSRHVMKRRRHLKSKMKRS